MVEFRRTLGGGVHHKPDGLQPACDVPKSMPVDGERKPGSMCVRAVRRPTIARLESEQQVSARFEDSPRLGEGFVETLEGAENAIHRLRTAL